MDKRNIDEFIESDFGPLKMYFDEREWSELSVYEKRRFSRIKRNYEDLVEMGVNPAVPPFMVKKKKLEIATICERGPRQKKICPEASTVKPPMTTTTTATTSNGGLTVEEVDDDIEITEVRQRNWVPRSTIDWESLFLAESEPFIPDEMDEMNIDLILEGTLKNLDRLKVLRKPCDADESDSERPSGNEPRSKYPKRNLPKVNYQEEEVSSDDDYIYCDDCGEPHDGSCPKHGPLKFMEDKEASRGPKHAWNTCPDYLSVCRSGIRGAGLGIWAEIDLNKGYVFGPYKGKIVKSRKDAKDSGYAWEIRRGGRVLHYVEGVDPSVWNWMRFVNCAVCEERQNLIAFQYHGQIWYRVYKEVKAYTELLVWYGDEFGEELGIIHRTQEETQLTKGVMKKLQLDRGVAPSTSIKKSCYSETSQEPSNRLVCNPTFLRAASSPDVPSEVNQEQISQASKYRKRGLRGITTEIDSDKSGVPKSEITYSVVEVNLVPSTQNKHVSVAEENGVYRKSHACPHCQYKTPSTSRLQCHINAIHEGKRPYQCQICDYSASQSSNLKTHIHSVHEGIRRYKCKQCDYRASRAEHLRTHIDAVHEKKKPYKCEHCDYRASETGSIRKHVDAVHEGRKPYKFPHCDYRAFRAAYLQKHVDAVHEGKKPHECPHCDYRATHISSLRRHVRAVHERLKPYGCRICDYRATQKSDLQKHMKAVHGGKENSEKKSN